LDIDFENRQRVCDFIKIIKLCEEDISLKLIIWEAVKLAQNMNASVHSITAL